jgi:kumamolisin
LKTDRTPLEGSRPRSTAAFRNCRDAPASQPVEATVVVRRRSAPKMQSRLDAILRGEAPPMSREEAEQSLGADPEDLRKVTEFAQAHGLTVTESSAPQRSVRISGTVAQMEAAFGVKLRLCQGGDRSYLCYGEPLTVPSSLAGIVEGVLGLDQRPVATHPDAD